MRLCLQLRYGFAAGDWSNFFALADIHSSGVRALGTNGGKPACFDRAGKRE
jgi:hypothetical protein